MDSDASGWLWILIDVVFVIALAGALAYGVARWRRSRSSGEAETRDRATERLYDKR
jgi:hypothetical protein